MEKPSGLDKDWNKAKEQLVQFSKEALHFAKKGEIEFRRLSQVSKIRFDLTALELKRERLIYRIGKEYVRIKTGGSENAALKKLVAEYEQVVKDQKSLKNKIHKSK